MHPATWLMNCQQTTVRKYQTFMFMHVTVTFLNSLAFMLTIPCNIRLSDKITQDVRSRLLVIKLIAFTVGIVLHIPECKYICLPFNKLWGYKLCFSLLEQIKKSAKNNALQYMMQTYFSQCYLFKCFRLQRKTLDGLKKTRIHLHSKEIQYWQLHQISKSIQWGKYSSVADTLI